jgi:hypothetical protein
MTDQREGQPSLKINNMKRVKIEYINGHNKGTVKEVAEAVSKILIKAGRAKKYKELKKDTETKELKNNSETKGVKSKPKKK